MKLVLLYVCVMLCGYFKCIKTDDIWNDYNGKSYFFSSEKPTWETAKTNCERRSSQLVVIETPDEFTYIQKYRNRGTSWIGLKRGPTKCNCKQGVSNGVCQQCRDTYKWIDGTRTGYRSWADRKPEGGSRACGVFLRGDTSLYDASTCSNENLFTYICQHTCSLAGCHRSNSQCRFQGDAYRCYCKPGYTGIHCDTDIDECEPQPCLNGAKCQDLINRYECKCVAGYTGTHCETDIDECSSSPCMNNGKCADKINGYSCKCSTGYTGRNCEQDINECSSNPCVYGNCTDLIAKYNCTCDSGYEGVNCDKEIGKSAVDTLERGLTISLGIGSVLLIISFASMVYLAYLNWKDSKATRMERASTSKL